MQRLRHVHFSFETRVHREERRTVQLLESRNQHNVDIFYVENIEVANVELGLAAVSKDLTANSLVKLLVLRQIVLELSALLAIDVLRKQAWFTPAWQIAPS